MNRSQAMKEKRPFYIHENPGHFIYSHHVRRTQNGVAIASVGGAENAKLVCDALNAYGADPAALLAEAGEQRRELGREE